MNGAFVTWGHADMLRKYLLNCVFLCECSSRAWPKNKHHVRIEGGGNANLPH